MRIALIAALGLLLFSCKKNSSNSNPIGPTALTATPVSTSQINLAWGDNATNEDGFKIERKTGSGNFSEIGSVGKDVTQYNDGGLTKNTTYTYRVYAFNAGGMSITYSNDATATTFDEVPAAASNLAALAVSSSQINLTWEDQATNETGYKVERKTINGSFSAVETISANATSYSDKGLSPNTYYTYRVYPFNAFGNGAFSNEASDTTFPDINNGLVAYYPFNGNAGDSSGNGNHGTVYGATLTSDRNGNENSAYSFNGINQFINVVNPSILNLEAGESFTVSFFYKPGSIVTNTNGFNGIIARFHSNGGPISGWQIGRDLNGLSFEANFCQYLSYVTLAPNIWKHYLVIFDRTNGFAKTYINGIYVNTSICESILGSMSNGYDLKIGVERLNILYVSGAIDDIKIYKRVLTQDQITYLSSH